MHSPDRLAGGRRRSQKELVRTKPRRAMRAKSSSRDHISPSFSAAMDAIRRSPKPNRSPRATDDSTHCSMVGQTRSEGVNRGSAERTRRNGLKSFLEAPVRSSILTGTASATRSSSRRRSSASIRRLWRPRKYSTQTEVSTKITFVFSGACARSRCLSRDERGQTYASVLHPTPTDQLSQTQNNRVCL